MTYNAYQSKALINTHLLVAEQLVAMRYEGVMVFFVLYSICAGLVYVVRLNFG